MTINHDFLFFLLKDSSLLNDFPFYVNKKIREKNISIPGKASEVPFPGAVELCFENKFSSKKFLAGREMDNVYNKYLKSLILFISL